MNVIQKLGPVVFIFILLCFLMLITRSVVPFPLSKIIVIVFIGVTWIFIGLRFFNPALFKKIIKILFTIYKIDISTEVDKSQLKSGIKIIGFVHK